MTTETDESAMASPAKIGERVQPKNGKKRPAASGIPMML